MGRTSQLQIRVSPEQKAALKRLAAAAGQNVSAYVLSRALPQAREELAREVDELRRGGASRTALAALAKVLSGLERDELDASLASMSVAGLGPPTQNRVTALVESVAHARGLQPPVWTAAIPPLARPHFRWPLASLRPHQMRATPTAYKRRNLFDPQLPALAPRPELRELPLQNLASLAEHLRLLELDVEFYFVSGAILWQTFPARPMSARPGALFAARREDDPVAPFVTAQGLGRGWLSDAVREVAGQESFLELPHVTVFQPPPEYALAVKVASLPREPLARDRDDLRFLLRSLNVASEDAALASISQYVADHYLPPHAREALRSLLVA